MATVAQSVLIFWAIGRDHLGLAMLSGIALASLTLVQFLNPTAHWYCLFFIVTIIALLSSMPTESRSRLVIVGVMLGLVFLTRQLTGVITGVAVLTFLIHERSCRSTSDERVSARRLLGSLVSVLAVDTCFATDLSGFILMGIWPLLIGAYVVKTARLETREVVRMIYLLALGALVVSLPLIVYHAINGSAVDFVDDVFYAALSLSRMDFIEQPKFAFFALTSAVQIGNMGSFATLANGIFWLFLIVSPAVLGIIFLIRLTQRAESTAWYPIFFLATFNALVSLHFQIPIYLFYSSALTLVGLLLITRDAWRGYHILVATLMAVSVVVGLYYQAGQPISRGIIGILEGERETRPTHCPVATMGLRLDNQQCQTYTRLLAIIDRHVVSHDTILALPVNPEIYFLSERKAPVRFFNSALAIRSQAQLTDTLSKLTADPPRLVFYRPDDKYNTDYTRNLADWVASRYELLAEFDGFVIYTLANEPQRIVE